jgi:methionyl-tRNA formyltransferase
MKVVILGKGEMLANLIEGALDAKAEIVGIFRYESTMRPSISNYFKTSHDLTLIKQYRLHNIKCKSANSENFKKEILRLNADIILVGTWGEKLKKEIIDLPTIATVNVHPSFLPKYRGPNPYLQTILHKETKSGITFHLMNKDFDRGAIIAQKEIKILPNDTGKELRERTTFQARLMCAEVLKKLEYGLVIPISQNEDEATYYPNVIPEDMMLDFSKETAEEIHARIRAFHPWLPCYITYNGQFYIPNPYKLKIVTSKTDFEYKDNTFTIKCKCGKSLEMRDVKKYREFLPKWIKT